MKRTYTTFVPQKRQFGKTDLEELALLVEAVKRKPQIKREHPEFSEKEFNAFTADVVINNRIRSGDCKHLYVQTKEFADWVATCVNKNSGEAVGLMQEKLATRGFVYHFPNGSGWDSFAVAILAHNDGGPNTDALIQFSKTAVRYPSHGLRKNLSEDFSNWTIDDTQPVVMSDGPKAPINPVLVFGQSIRFAVGLAAYMSCFPETVKPGLPEDLKHPSYHQAPDVFTVGVAEKIRLGGTHASPYAHFRNGHIRVLRSEKFTKMRFQTIFIADTFVNGKSATVLSPEETQTAS